METQEIDSNITEDESYPGRRCTRAILKGPEINVLLEIWGPPKKRERRAIILAMLLELSPWIRLVRRGHIVHRDAHWKTILNALDRRVSLRDALKTDTRARKTGAEIRMQRLKIGLSQKSLAKASRLSRSYLSDLERGKCVARKETLAAIFRAFSAKNPSAFEPDKPTLG